MKKLILCFFLALSTNITWGQSALDFISGDAPYLSGYANRKTLLIDNTGNPLALAGDQINIVLNSSQSDVFAASMTNGEDLRFTSADGSTLLNYYIESYSKVGNTASVWVAATISAANSERIFMYYNKPGSTTASSFTNTMTRFQTTEINAKYVVRFNDGSGSTAANTGSDGGTMALQGGFTWESSDTYGGTTGRLKLNGSSGYIEKSGLLDSWPTEGHLHWRINYVGSNVAGTFLLYKRHALTAETGGQGTYVSLFVDIGGHLQLRVFKGLSQTTITGTATTLSIGNNYDVSLTWNANFLYVYINGTLEFRMTATLPTSFGTQAPFRIGCTSSGTDNSAGTFANIRINDFSYQDYQEYLPKIQAIHKQRTFIQKDEASKWAIAHTAQFGGSDGPNCSIEPQINWDGSQFVVYYTVSNTGTTPVNQLYRRTTSALSVTGTNSWSSGTHVLGGSGTGYTPQVYRACTRNFSGSWYSFFLGSGAVGSAGDILVSTSSDGITWNTPTVALSKPVNGFGQTSLFNTDVSFDSGLSVWVMFVDGIHSGVDTDYNTGVATCATLTGTYSLFGSNPKTSMAYGAKQYATPSSAIRRVNGRFYVHQSQKPENTATSLPQDIYTVYSTDLNNWTKPNAGSVISRERSWEFEQGADQTEIEVNGTVYMLWNGTSNGSPFASSISLAKFNGTYEQLYKDLTITFQ